MAWESKVVRETLRRWRIAQRTGEISSSMPTWCTRRYCASTPRELDAWFPAWLRQVLAHANMPKALSVSTLLSAEQRKGLKTLWRTQWYGLPVSPQVLIYPTADWR